MNFIPDSLEATYKHIEVLDGNYVKENQKEQVRIKICDDNGDTFIVTSPNVLLAPDICDGSFSIITLTNSGNTCLFNTGFFTVYFSDREKNAVTLPKSAQRKHAFWGGIKQMSKTYKLAPRKRIALELLHHRLGNRSTI